MRGSLRDVDAHGGGDSNEFDGIGRARESVDHGESVLGIDEEQPRGVDARQGMHVQGRGDLGGRTEIHVAAVQLLAREFAYGARDVMGSTHAAQRALFVLGGLRPRRLVSAFGQRIGIDRHAKGGSELEARCDHLGAQGVLPDREERHAAPVDSPIGPSSWTPIWR